MLVTVDHTDLLNAIRSSLTSQAYELSDRVIPDAVLARVARNIAQAVMCCKDELQRCHADESMWSPDNPREWSEGVDEFDKAPR